MSESTTSLSLTTPRRRVGAFVIDDMVVALLLFAIFYDQIMVMASHLPVVLTPEAMEAFKLEINQFTVENLSLILGLKILYHTIPVWQNGTTLGKYLMKMRVVDSRGAWRVSFVQALLRASLRIVSEAFFYLGFVMAFFMPRRQTFHDKLSGCVVVDA